MKGCMAAGHCFMNDSSFLKIKEVLNESLGSWHIVIDMYRQMNK